MKPPRLPESPAARQARKRINAKLRKARKAKRVVLGTGYPWFWFKSIHDGFDSVTLCKVAGYGAARVILKLGTLGNYNRIRLVAEVLK